MTESLARLVADAEAQLSGPLHLLAMAAAELPDGPERRGLNAAASHLNCALVRLARLDRPARRDLSSPGVAVATSGEPGFTLPLSPAAELLAAAFGRRAD